MIPGTVRPKCYGTGSFALNLMLCLRAVARQPIRSEATRFGVYCTHCMQQKRDTKTRQKLETPSTKYHHYTHAVPPILLFQLWKGTAAHGRVDLRGSVGGKHDAAYSFSNRSLDRESRLHLY
jgi:hypothetical protein